MRVHLTLRGCWRGMSRYDEQYARMLSAFQISRYFLHTSDVVIDSQSLCVPLRFKWPGRVDQAIGTALRHDFYNHAHLAVIMNVLFVKCCE